ncbi:MAG: electron transfer flavoprotein subunit alpha/FixB family protein [Deltaproteobacteria bacterium]|jgi:electron transfer flavoprotein alpha subunit|nr:electron transfer flavoprotein subunit alpha/FixB family protein [Deltaproteobacteria bacterium]MBT4265428.1 electron transfer flavoprotein subunit alpha/FixB family protein [Deltaproteobacteria bacterium]MBT4643641.1 electron transfer flavoprotein subunit alpha/FixB family protein [Deltaproteobacteria bacterium]MBT6500163.1 electron transfer flavoprotein subunit alpha/FixB family protein [Deltaproteobacteria bacterium]MBT7152199.1 electron transfer flavoprotein subunit alpha/FixB family pro
MAQIFAYIVHKDGVADDTALELVVAAKKLDASVDAIAVVTGSGAELDTVCNDVAASYKEVYKIDNEALAYPNAEVVRKALVNVLPADGIVLVPHTTFGMDLGPGLSIKMDSAFVADAVDFEGVDGSTLKVVRQEFGGQVSAHMECDISGGAVINVRPGPFLPDESKSAGGQVVDKSGDAGDLAVGRKYLEIIVPEAGDVDITKSDVLVSVGRGIEDEENIEVANELAEAMGAVVSCSRPIVDAKWLDKSRQVGTSGQTVKPKVYMAMGISGSFQHLGGIKGSPFIVAVNKNPKAPIFQVADVGIVADILEFMPELTEKINEG